MSPLHVAITSSIAASFEKQSFNVWVIGMSPVELQPNLSPVELQPDMPFRADFWIFHVIHKPLPLQTRVGRRHRSMRIGRIGWRSREFTALFPHLLKEIARPFQTFFERFLRCRMIASGRQQERQIAKRSAIPNTIRMPPLGELVAIIQSGWR